VFVLVLALYAGVYFMARPSRFDVSVNGVEVVFPFWTRGVPARGLVGARELSARDFQREFGWGLRIGVGGLWGVFGWLWTRRGLVEVYVSRTDGWCSWSAGRGVPSC
jgi:hypothetical protein